MSATTVDGKYWVAELQRLREQDATLGHWAHTLLDRARRLQARGLLSMKTPQQVKWRSHRLTRGETYVPLVDKHRDWLIAQASILRDLSHSNSDPVGRCAGYFMDWLIWFWTADACHPNTLSVRRDAIKYDYSHLWSTDEARSAVDAGSTSRIRVGSMVEHEHAVPKRTLINLIMSGQLIPRDVLTRFAHAVIVTKEEHRHLNRHFPDRMPTSWDPTSTTADPFARYHEPAVNIAVNPPRRRVQGVRK